MIVRTVLTLTLLGAGIVAVLDDGGTGVDVAGVLAIGIALLTLERAVFRAVGADAEADERPARPT